jgi:SAM-dependent methyltransferase
VRLEQDARRAILWKSLCRFFFSDIVPADGCVLDLGCGYGDFINNISARRRIAVDSWPEFPDYLQPGIEAITRTVTELECLEDYSVDFAFASNLFEHLTTEQFSRTLALLSVKLSERGTLNILQPNYRYAYREYFDDYTHISVFSHVSLSDFLKANGYEVFDVRPRFMPFSIKSRFPVSPFLIAAYLRSPIKPLGKQMLVRARVRH